MNGARGGNSCRHTDVVVIGAGQAGLSCSHYLSIGGVDHVLLERGEVANSWRNERWDSLRLLTPNWQSQLPGWSYRGDAPDGFMDMKGVVDFITGFARQEAAPVQAHTTVTAVVPLEKGFRVETDRGNWRCRALVVASGAFNTSCVPGLASALPDNIEQLTTHQYRNPGQLGSGGVLVVGAAASGAQIADEIRRSGRDVTLAVGEHVRMPRCYRGRDIQYWLEVSGLLDENYRTMDDLQRVRSLPSAQLIGSQERRNLDLNSLGDAGVKLVGRLAGVNGRTAQFSGSLANTARLADLKMGRLLDGIDEWIGRVGHDTCGEGVWRPEPTRLDSFPQLGLDLGSGEFQTVLWAIGHRPDYSWLNVPVVDHRGFAQHDGGVGSFPGVYFMGLPFMRRRKSSFLWGASDDARDICGHLMGYLGCRSVSYKGKPRKMACPRYMSS